MTSVVELFPRTRKLSYDLQQQLREVEAKRMAPSDMELGEQDGYAAGGDDNDDGGPLALLTRSTGTSSQQHQHHHQQQHHHH